MTAVDTDAVSVRTAMPPATSSSPGNSAEESSERVPLLARPLASYYLIASAAGLLLVLGLVMVLSASSVVAYSTSGSPFAIFAKQALWVAIGIPLLIMFSRMPIARFRAFAYPLLIATTVGLVMVLVPGIGVSANGATRWVGIGPLQIQPSELAKLALVLWGADLLVRKRRLLGEWRHLMVPLLPMATLLCLLIMMQPDLGTCIVTFSVVMTLLWVVGSPKRLFGSLLSVVAFAVTVLAVLEPYRLQRLTSFTNPFHDAQSTGYQAVQGIYALSSGGWWGLGLGASREKWSYLPHAHTDFILAIIGEELGLVGTLVVVVLFCVLAFGGIRVAQRSRDPFVRLAAAGITAWIVGQALINMGAVVGLLPITGIPLPLISFGGSALVPTMVAIGMLLAMAKTEPAAAQVVASREARRSARKRGRPKGEAAAKPAGKSSARATSERRLRRGAPERRRRGRRASR